MSRAPPKVRFDRGPRSLEGAASSSGESRSRVSWAKDVAGANVETIIVEKANIEDFHWFFMLI